ncbi:MAG: methyltransferase domain-containing protein [Defluviitaleaceae bacterium]|nr:methyltransferase domain-containing protein [Defluviitaleaceae bacterium]
MSAYLAFSNDIDSTTWDAFNEYHKVIYDELGVEIDDSFWLFDPDPYNVRRSDMALFKRDLSQKGDFHDEILLKIKQGKLSALHGVGNFSYYLEEKGKLENYLTRNLIKQGLEFLAENDAMPKIWTNHGNNANIQNIAGAYKREHHQGDAFGADCYILDLLVKYGFKYFWTDKDKDRVHFSLTDMTGNRPILSNVVTDAGYVIKTFKRYRIDMKQSPTALTLGDELSEENLSKLAREQGCCILYQHLGSFQEEMRRASGTPVFNDHAIEGLRRLRKYIDSGDITVLPLLEMLEKVNSLQLHSNVKGSKNVAADEITVALETGIPEAEIEATDEKTEKIRRFIEKEYGFSLDYHLRQLDRIGFSGIRALDAGCGAGQWSIALAHRFEHVEAIDMNADLIAALSQAKVSANVDNITEQIGSIEELPFDSNGFDAVYCNGVLMFPDVRKTLREYYRTLKPGGRLYACLNSDGQGHYLTSRVEDKRGRKKGMKALYQTYWRRFIQSGCKDEEYLLEEVKANLSKGFVSVCQQDLLLGEEAIEKFRGTYSYYRPDEIEQIANSVGFVGFEWDEEGLLSKGAVLSAPEQRYLGRFGEHVAVWEFMCEKPMI